MWKKVFSDLFYFRTTAWWMEWSTWPTTTVSPSLQVATEAPFLCQAFKDLPPYCATNILQRSSTTIQQISLSNWPWTHDSANMLSFSHTVIWSLLCGWEYAVHTLSITWPLLGITLYAKLVETISCFRHDVTWWRSTPTSARLSA